MESSSAPPGFQVLDQGRVTLRNEEAEALKAVGWGSWEKVFQLDTGQIVRRAAGRVTRRLSLPDGSIGFLKTYPSPSWWTRWRSQPAAAAREARNQCVLRQQGFPVARPLAWGTDPEGRSFLLTSGISGRDLRSHLAEGWRTLVADSGQQRAWILGLAGLVARFHGLGWHHRDLYLNHFLRQPDGSLALLALQRARCLSPLGRRWIVKDLAALESSCPAAVSRSDRLRFLLAYLDRPQLDEEVRRWVGEVQRKALQYRRHVPKYPG